MSPDYSPHAGQSGNETTRPYAQIKMYGQIIIINYLFGGTTGYH